MARLPVAVNRSMLYCCFVWVIRRSSAALRATSPTVPGAAGKSSRLLDAVTS
jgi:hypothetical protein